jgi:ATP-dependent Clp endopeptidase proteolytic subunit ClpP
MSLRTLPEIRAFQRPDGMTWDPPADALERWTPRARVNAAEGDATLNIFDVIGEDLWTGEGWTAKRVAGILRSIGEKPLAVQINSPGGDVFEGLAIYNLLRAHKAEVTVRVLGLAASAASVIAMAGDRIEMGRGSMLMIHNAWGVTIGNRHDMRAAADILEPIDDSMADVYAARSGQDKKRMAKAMDAETWFTGPQAVEEKLADGLIDDPAPDAADPAARAQIAARHQLDVILAKSGVARSERRRLLREASNTGTPGAADPATRDAGLTDAAASLRRLLANLQT